jgi:hypothetical protein
MSQYTTEWELDVSHKRPTKATSYSLVDFRYGVDILIILTNTYPLLFKLNVFVEQYFYIGISHTTNQQYT